MSLSLTRTDKQEISRVLNHANRHKITREKVEQMFAKKLLPVGDDPNYRCFLKAGKRTYRVVFSYEEQPVGWMRHISMSCDKPMSVMEVNQILNIFLFKSPPLVDLLGESTPSPSMRVWWEKAVNALNIIEAVDTETAEKAREGDGLTMLEKVSNSAYVIQPAQPLAEHIQ